MFSALRRLLTLPQKINSIFFRKKFCRFNLTALPLRQKAARNKRAAENQAMKVSFTYNTSHTTNEFLGFEEIEVERCFQVTAEVIGDGEVDAVNLLDVYCQETFYLPQREIVFPRAEMFVGSTPIGIWQDLETEAIDRASLGMNISEAA